MGNMKITRCGGAGCPVKLKCKRYIGKYIGDEYFSEVPGKIETINGKKTFTCEMFWSDQFDLNEIIFGE
jgi:hypothetical protein